MCCQVRTACDQIHRASVGRPEALSHSRPVVQSSDFSTVASDPAGKRVRCSTHSRCSRRSLSEHLATGTITSREAAEKVNATATVSERTAAANPAGISLQLGCHWDIPVRVLHTTAHPRLASRKSGPSDRCLPAYVRTSCHCQPRPENVHLPVHPPTHPLYNSKSIFHLIAPY